MGRGFNHSRNEKWPTANQFYASGHFPSKILEKKKLIVYLYDWIELKVCENFFTLRHVVIPIPLNAKVSIMKNQIEDDFDLPSFNSPRQLIFVFRFSDSGPGDPFQWFCAAAIVPFSRFDFGWFSSKFFWFWCSAGPTWQNGRPWSFFSAVCLDAIFAKQNDSSSENFFKHQFFLTKTPILC